jgi:hypothetical protein
MRLTGLWRVLFLLGLLRPRGYSPAAATDSGTDALHIVTRMALAVCAMIWLGTAAIVFGVVALLFAAIGSVPFG